MLGHVGLGAYHDAMLLTDPQRRTLDRLIGTTERPVFAADLRQRLVDRIPELLRHHPELVQQREDDALRVGEQRVQHMIGFDLLVVSRRRLPVRLLERGLRLDGQPVEFHTFLASSKPSRVMPYIT